MDITKKEIKVSSITVPPLPDQTISREVLLEKYAKGTESSIAEVRARIAHALAAVEPEDKRAVWEKRFLNAMEAGFIPAGRIMSAAGIQMQATLINCFVQPVGDSISEIVDGKPGIYTALQQAAETMRRGGGVGYDFSSIRPKGSEVKGTHSRACGPVSYMRVFDRSCETVESAGLAPRRADGRAALRPSRTSRNSSMPRIAATCPTSTSRSASPTPSCRRWRTTPKPNSCTRREPHKELMDAGRLPARGRPVGLPQAARARAVGPDHALDLRPRRAGDPVPRPHEPRQQPQLLRDHRGHQSLRRTAAAALWLLLPGLDQPDATSSPPRSPRKPRSISSASARRSRLSVRMLDNVLDATAWPLPQQQEEAMNKRRVGLGYTGLGDALIMLRLRYDSDEARAHGREDLGRHARLRLPGVGNLAARARRLPAVQCRHVSVGRQLRLAPAAGNQGADPEARPAQQPPAVDRPHRHHQPGLRRQRLNGIEPPFSWTYTRKKRMADGTLQEFPVEDYAWRLYRHLVANGALPALPAAPKRCPIISSPRWKSRPRRTKPWWRRSRPISTPASPRQSTCRQNYPYEDFQGLYMAAWKSGLKGLATYRPNSVLGSVLSVDSAASEAAAGFRQQRRQPAHRRSRRCPSPCSPACAGPAGPSCPKAIRPGPT